MLGKKWLDNMGLGGGKFNGMFLEVLKLISVPTHIPFSLQILKPF